jgi:hypothetical protein
MSIFRSVCAVVVVIAVLCAGFNGAGAAETEAVEASTAEATEETVAPASETETDSTETSAPAEEVEPATAETGDVSQSSGDQMAQASTGVSAPHQRGKRVAAFWFIVPGL